MRRLVVGFVLAGLMVLPSLVIVDPAGATVPGENGLLVYVQDVPSQVSGVTAGEIYTMYPDGTVVRRLTSDAGRSDGTTGGSDVVVSENYSPRWSPDSPIIAYVHMNESAEYSVRLMDAEGTFIRTVTEAFSPITSLAWSPDGSQPRHRRDRPRRQRRRDLDHRSVRRQSPSRGEGRIDGWLAWSIRDLDWSPDGSSIAFSARSGSNSRQILLTQVDTGSLSGPFSGGTWAYQPRWDPSGSRIIFTAYTGPTTGDPDTMGSLDDTDVWVNEYPKTSAQPLIAEPGGQHTPTISPDGSQVLYISESDSGLWSQADGRIVTFTGRDVDWQPIQRIAQSVGLVDPRTGKWHITTLHGMINQFYYGNPGDFPMMGDWDCNGNGHARAVPPVRRIRVPAQHQHAGQRRHPVLLRQSRRHRRSPATSTATAATRCRSTASPRAASTSSTTLGSDDGGLGAADYDYYFGNPGDKPFVGDFNGDGVDTVGLHRESTGLVYFRNTNTQGNAEFEFYFGDPGDRLVAGDWSYDGIDTRACTDPRTARSTSATPTPKATPTNSSRGGCPTGCRSPGTSDRRRDDGRYSPM